MRTRGQVTSRIQVGPQTGLGAIRQQLLLPFSRGLDEKTRFGQMRQKPDQITAVGADGIRREPVIKPERFKKPREQRRRGGGRFHAARGRSWCRKGCDRTSRSSAKYGVAGIGVSALRARTTHA